MQGLRTTTAIALMLAWPGAAAEAAERVQRVGRVVMRIDDRYAFPGGALLVRVSSTGRLGGVNAILDGRRVALQQAGGLQRGLVPVPLETQPGSHRLGFEVATRGQRRQRLPMELDVFPRRYAERAVVLPGMKLGLLASRDARQDARRLMAALRAGDASVSPSAWLKPPAPQSPGLAFGAAQTYVGVREPVQAVLDAGFGDQHRGLDYDLPPGSTVLAPGRARVTLARWLAGTGWTLVLDHGGGLLSTLWHLSELSVSVDQYLEAGTPVARSGDSGLASHPHVHWGVYLHGVPIDPDIAMRGFGE